RIRFSRPRLDKWGEANGAYLFDHALGAVGASQDISGDRWSFGVGGSATFGYNNSAHAGHTISTRPSTGVTATVGGDWKNSASRSTTIFGAQDDRVLIDVGGMQVIAGGQMTADIFITVDDVPAAPLEARVDVLALIPAASARTMGLLPPRS